MQLYYEGMIACAAILGGLCAFNYWMFNIIESKLENKIDHISLDVKSLILNVEKHQSEIQVAHRRMDQLYGVIIEMLKK